MRVCGCTIAARPMLASAVVVARSFAEQHPELEFFTLLADAPGPTARERTIPGEMIDIDELQRPDLLRRAFRAGQQEFTYAVTPALLAHLLERGFDAVLFYKQESLLLDRQDEAIARLADCDVLLTPHLLDPVCGADAAERERGILLSGVYNLGFLAVTDRPESRRLLAWWDARLETHCRHAVADGMHFEQRWMDLAPSLFSGIGVMRDPEFNVGHWNVTERAVTADAEGEDVRVGGRPCALFRFSGYDPRTPESMTRYSDRVPVTALGPAAAVFDRYRRELLAAGWASSAMAGYGFADFHDGRAIPEAARRLHRALPEREAARFGDPFAGGAGSFRGWATAAADERMPPVSRLMLAVRDERADLVAAFPDPLGVHREAFAGWFQQTRAEHGVAAELDPAPAVTRGPAVLTVLTADRLAQARVLAASLRTHHPELPLHVLLFGEAPSAPDRAGEPFVRLPRPVSLMAHIDSSVLAGRLLDAAARSKAAGIQSLLQMGHDRVIYLDCDMEVLGDLEPLLDATAQHDVTLIPHVVDPPGTPPRLDSELLLLKAGTFNAGVLACRSGPVALAFLDWWARRMVQGADYAPEEGVFHEQRWLDLAPALFDGVGVLRDPRFDVGPWNVHQRLDDDWRLMHYSGFDPIRPDLLSTHQPGLTFDGAHRARSVYARYARALLDAGWNDAAASPPPADEGLPVVDHRWPSLRRVLADLRDALPLGARRRRRGRPRRRRLPID